jgi:hypothetical protein
MHQLVDFRDFISQNGQGKKLYPYAKNLYFHPSGVLSMTIEIYDDVNTQEFTFGFTPSGKLRGFLEQLYEVDNGI